MAHEMRIQACILPSMQPLTSKSAALECAIAVGVEALGALEAAVLVALDVCKRTKFAGSGGEGL